MSASETVAVAQASILSGTHFRLTPIDASMFQRLKRTAAILLATGVCAAAVADDSSLRVLLSGTESSAEETMNPLNAGAAAGEQPIRRFRRRAVQNVSVRGGLLAAADDDLSSRFFETSIGLGVPLGSFDNILGVTPSFRVDWLNSSAGADVPQELYETGVNLFWRKPLKERLSVMTVVRPSIRSDFTTSDRALRLFGLALLNWEQTPDCLTLSFGTVWLGRADLPVLPAAGLTWTPQPRTRVELRFPESKCSWRLAKDGATSETWVHCAIGIGGNTWAVTRQSGLTDELSLRDIRLRLGIEHVMDGGAGWFAETGVALNRRLEYENTATEVSLSEAVLLRAGWTW